MKRVSGVAELDSPRSSHRARMADDSMGANLAGSYTGVVPTHADPMPVSSDLTLPGVSPIYDLLPIPLGIGIARCIRWSSRFGKALL